MDLSDVILLVLEDHTLLKRIRIASILLFLGLCILKELVLKFLHPVFKSSIKKLMAIKHVNCTHKGRT